MTTTDITGRIGRNRLGPPRLSGLGHTALVTTPDMTQLLSAWRAAGAHVDLGAPADETLIARAESELGFPLPREVRELYSACNGMALASGDLVLHPLAGSESVISASRQLREAGRSAAAELLVLGHTGGEEVIGVWAVPDARRTLVVAMGPPPEEADLAVLGTSLAGFLAAWTAYVLPLGDPGDDPAVADCVAELGSPRPRASAGDEEHLEDLLTWASPDLPEPGLGPTELTRLAQQP
jgi:hypothetical protein